MLFGEHRDVLSNNNPRLITEGGGRDGSEVAPSREGLNAALDYRPVWGRTGRRPPQAAVVTRRPEEGPAFNADPHAARHSKG
jgi:hypothetical protein